MPDGISTEIFNAQLDEFPCMEIASESANAVELAIRRAERLIVARRARKGGRYRTEGA